MNENPWPPQVSAVETQRVPNSDIAELMEEWVELEDVLTALLDNAFLGCRQAE